MVEEANEMQGAQEAAEAAAAAKAKLTPQEVEQRAAELLETAKQEYEETKLIMETPAGYEFVPGLDDSWESLEYLKSRNGTDTSPTTPTPITDDAEFLGATPEERYEDFLEEVEEDYENLTNEGKVTAS